MKKVYTLPPYNPEKEGRPSSIELIGVTLTKEQEAVIRSFVEQGDIQAEQGEILAQLENWKREALFTWRLIRFQHKWIERKRKKREQWRKRR